MHRIDRYLFGEIFGPFIASLVFLFTLLFAMQMLRGIEIMLGASVSVFDLFYVAMCLVPHFVVMAVPISFLFAVVIGLGRLSEDREIMALQASGVGPARLWVAPVALAAVLSAIGIGFGYGPEPIGLAEVDRHINELIKKNMAGDVKPGVFYDAIKGITLFAQDVSPKSRKFTNVLVVDEREERESTLWLAKGGYVDPHGSGSSLLLQLDDGEIHRISESDDAHQSESVVAGFDQCTLNIRAQELLKKNRFGATRREAMLPHQMKVLAADLREEASTLRQEAEKLSSAGIPQATDEELKEGTAEKNYATQMATYLEAIGGEEARGLADDLLQSANRQAAKNADATQDKASENHSDSAQPSAESAPALEVASAELTSQDAGSEGSSPDVLASQAKASTDKPLFDKTRPDASLDKRSQVLADAKRSLRRDQIKRAKSKEKSARVLDVARARRLAGPLASIVFAMCAVPLAIGKKHQRGGSGIGVLATLACYIGYYTLERIGEGLGESGALPAMLAAQVPNLAFFCFGLWLVRRSFKIS